MTNMNTNYTACFSVVLGTMSLNHLREECRIMTGVDACNIEHHDDVTHFTITTEVDVYGKIENEVDPDTYFNEIAVDLSRWVGTTVTLNEIFVDD